MAGKKILIIRYKPLKYFFQCLPAFAAIRKHHKDDEITILTERSLVKLCKKSQLFDKVWLDEMPKWFNVPGVIDIIKRLMAGRFDMVYDLQNDKRSEWYFRLMGFKKPKWNSQTIQWCSHYYKPENYDLHFQDIIHNQLKVAGIRSTPQIDISYMAAGNEAEGLPERFVMICAAGDRKKAPLKLGAQKYADIIDLLHEKYKITSVLIGDKNDDFWANDLISKQCVKAKPINFAGKTSITGIMDVARKAVLCLGNDTAPTHIAAYSGCKTVMICSRFSPPEIIAPKVKNLAWIEEPMLEDVTVERVMGAIEEFALVNTQKEAFESFKVASQEESITPEILSKKAQNP